MKFIARHLNLIGLLLLVSFVAAAAGLYLGVPEKVNAAALKSGAAQFTCPMHPLIVRSFAGDCPECGMKLVARPAGELAVETKPAKGCCSSKPVIPSPAISCPHLAGLTNSAPKGCCPQP